MFYRRHLGSDSGFTLTEMLFVFAILATLVLIAVASFSIASDRATAGVCRANQRIVQDAVYSYQAANPSRSLPTTLGAVAPYVRSSLSPDICPKDDTVHYTYDPANGFVSCPLHP